MLSYLVRRLLLVIPTLIGMTMVVFFVMALSPGGVGASLLTREGSMRAQDRKALEAYYNKRYGLDKPAVVQYVRWLNQVSPVGIDWSREGWTRWVPFKSPDLGESFTRKRPVIDVIVEALPITLLLNAITIPLVYLVSLYLGIRAARLRGKTFDIASGTLLLALWSIPTIWAGVMLIGMFANKQYFKWFPTAGLHDILSDRMLFLPHRGPDGFERGWLLDMCWHLVLPIICLTYGSFAVLTKLTRGSFLENISLDYVRTARAKGLGEPVVLYQHVFRNSLLPLITVASSILPSLIVGSVIVESIFSIPGMGKLAIDAANSRDRELIMAVALVSGLIGLISYLLADICYAIADPRVSYE